MGGYSNWAFRWSQERMQRFLGHGLPTYLRVQSDVGESVQSEEFLQFGFQVSASGQSPVQDIQIDPPAIVEEVSMHNIGLNSSVLRFGARKFTINQTWVKARQQAMGYVIPDTLPPLPDYYRVFADPTVIGIFYDARLFLVVSITHDDIGTPPNQQPYVWHLICNAAEQPPTT